MPPCVMEAFFSLLLLFLLFSRADALFLYSLLRCQFTSPNDSFYLEELYFNKVLLIQYNSSLGNYTGYTENAKNIAESLNKSPSLHKEENNHKRCKSHALLASEIFSKPGIFSKGEPIARVRSVEAAGSKHPAMLVCSVYNFYPKQIRLTWLRNGKEVTSDVTSTEELPNGNWLYQIHSYLEYTPKPGEKISCMVEHASLTEPELYDWVQAPELQENKIAIGTAGLLLGLVFFVFGLIYYKKNAAGHQLVPTS